MISEVKEVPFDDQVDSKDVPEGWVSTRLGCGLVIDVQPGFACGANNREGEGIPHLRPMNINAGGQIRLANLKYVPESEVDRGERLLGPGDVIFNNTNSPDLVGKTAFYDLREPRAFSNHMTRLRCRLDVFDPHFCAMAVHQKWREGYFRTVCNNHVSQSSVGRTALLDTAILLPPLAEQGRIVAKAEELLIRVNATRGGLTRAALILKRFRQAVLAAACSGRLTEEWRGNNPAMESAENVVEGIRRRRMVQEVTSSQVEKLNEVYAFQEEGNSDLLPEGWRYVALDKLCGSFQYGTSRKSSPSGKVSVLRMGNIQGTEIDWHDLVYTSDEDEIEKYKLRAGDILFNRTNSPELVGKTAIYKGERPAIFAGYLIRISNLQELDSRYLNFCLNTLHAREYCMAVKTDGVSQSNINAQKLGKFEVPFCPLSEQLEIVRRVEALFKLADSIEKRVAAATARANKLAQSILAKAFRGELVPTEAELARREGRSYEPASALLARIQAEREAKVLPKPARRNPRRQDVRRQGVRSA